MTNQANSQITFDHLCSVLNYKPKLGFVTSESEASDAFQKNIFKYAQEKLEIDAIFFYTPDIGPSIPFIYFKKFEQENLNEIAKLHKLVWNMGQAPLLFVILPERVLIYNGYKPPKIVDGNLDATAGFIEELKIFIKADSEIKRLKKYQSSELLTGNYWKAHNEEFDRKRRVNESLLENLEIIRRKLLIQKLPNEVIHNLIIRTLFIKYLEDRKDKLGNCVFPKDFFSNYLNSAERFVDILSDKTATYSLFKDLSIKFNGDLFFVENEETLVTQKHLDQLQKMLKGEVYLKNNQTTLWPLYSFDVIPIELISNIYQKVVHNEHEKTKRESGTHYTPYHLATFLMDQVLPWDGDYSDIRILDPSCGSGIFLVESYRRLINRWKNQNNKRPSISDLNQILSKNIFGVDINGRAIRIAALSLYLTLCDYLEPRVIWDNLKFKPLINYNLYVSDFFTKNTLFSSRKYDIIVGNPPWESKLSEKAEQYIKETGKPIGDKQICQAFLWHVIDLCKPTGEICMIVSSKSLLFNRSNKTRSFRRQFFSSFSIKSIVNFSLLRSILYSNAVGPCASIIFTPRKDQNQSIVYCTPKPTYSPQDDWVFIIEPQDTAEISIDDAIENDIIWKISMWGNPRDHELINRLSRLPTLNDICKKYGWIDGEGFIVGRQKREIDLQLYKKPYIDVDNLKKFYVDESNLPLNENQNFYRCAKRKREIFEGPHLLIQQSPKVDGIVSAVLDKDAIFNGSIVGIHSKKQDVDKLAICCAIINSKMALYYQILTSRKWLVERVELQKEEIMNLPIPEEILQQGIFNYQKLKELANDPNSETKLNNLVNQWYGFKESELILIDDLINYSLDFYYHKKKSRALLPANEKILGEYAKIYCNLLNNTFSNEKKFQLGYIYKGNGPLKVVSINLGKRIDDHSINFQSDLKLHTVLEELNAHLIEEISKDIYIRRFIKRYSADTIFIVKPNEQRFWTKSTALRDADETVKEIMSFKGEI
jgi:hypothetical protein